MSALRRKARMFLHFMRALGRSAFPFVVFEITLPHREAVELLHQVLMENGTLSTITEQNTIRAFVYRREHSVNRFLEFCSDNGIAPTKDDNQSY